jgi:protein-disulfide isomerase
MMLFPKFAACSALLALVLIGGGPAGAQQRDRSMLHVSQFPLIADDGSQVANHAVKLPGAVERLPGVVTVGNDEGKVALVEFYDLNCPFCRIASVDIGDMVDTDADLKLVLVPFPVLGPASIAASRVELAVAKLGTAKQFYAFHQKIYAERGITDGERALDVAQSLCFDRQVLTMLGNSDEVTQMMKNHVALGDSLGLAATPSFVAGGVAILGYPGRQTLQAVVDAVAGCGKVAC